MRAWSYYTDPRTPVDGERIINVPAGQRVWSIFVLGNAPGSGLGDAGLVIGNAGAVAVGSVSGATGSIIIPEGSSFNLGGSDFPDHFCGPFNIAIINYRRFVVAIGEPEHR